MRIAVVADTFPPLRTSGAVQLRDLTEEFSRSGYVVTVILPVSGEVAPWSIETLNGISVVRLRTLPIKDVGWARRFFAELLMPFLMLWRLRRSPLANERWDGVVWYSPSIFHGPFVRSLKRRSNAKGYLVIRDIFPDWALDMGLIRRGPAFYVLRAVARYQYSVADVIGVQTAGNLTYFSDWRKKNGRKLEILPNWLGSRGAVRCGIRVSGTQLIGRNVFVYAGNMGVAQRVGRIIDLAERLSGVDGIGFLLVGRGSEFARLAADARLRGLTNVVFRDEIDPDEIPDLFSQCSVGVVALDPRHKTHNIPGKFLTYMQAGLPVLAMVNRGNDIVDLIRAERVGEVCDSDEIQELARCAVALLTRIETDKDLSRRCRALFDREYSVGRAARQIVSSLLSVS
jgi:glycosyltransferase involved in cell wall biosynthesis